MVFVRTREFSLSYFFSIKHVVSCLIVVVFGVFINKFENLKRMIGMKIKLSCKHWAPIRHQDLL